MKFTAPSAILARAAELAKKTSAKHAPFDRVLLQGGAQLVLTSRTSSLALRQVIDVPALGEEIVVPADALARDTAKLSGEVTAKIDPAKACMVLAAKPRRFVLPMSTDTEVAPRMPVMGDVSREVFAGTLRTALERVKHAVCLDDTRAHLNGVLIEAHGDALRSVATNGHYMSIYGNRAAGAEASWLFPLAMIAPLLDLLPESGAVRVRWTESHLSVEGAGWTLTQSRFVGEFPTWSQIVPQGAAPVRVTTDARALGAEIGAAFSLAEKHLVRFDLADGTLHVHGESHGREASTELAVDAEPRTAKMRFAVNGEYLLAVLGSLPAGECTVGLSAALEPLTVTPADGSSLSVLMPMRDES